MGSPSSNRFPSNPNKVATLTGKPGGGPEKICFVRILPAVWVCLFIGTLPLTPSSRVFGFQPPQHSPIPTGSGSPLPRAPQLAGASPESPPHPRTGLHLVEAFLPLKVGNRWTYNVELNGKKRAKPFVMEITRMVIRNFRSYYLFNRFPFGATPESPTPIIRFDRRTQAFYQLVNDQEEELYPPEGEHEVKVESSETPGGQPDLQVMKLSFAPPSPSLPAPVSAPPRDEVVFKYLIGVVSAIRATQMGTEKYTLIRTEENAPVQAAQAAGPKEPVTHEEPPPQQHSPYASSGPDLQLSVEPGAEPGRIKFVLGVENKHERMVPLNFKNDQSFDFIILSPTSSEPIWKWSTTHYFSKVKRSIGLLSGESREYSAEWDGLDSSHQPVAAGRFTVIGILTSDPEIRTEPVEFQYTPPPPQ